MLHKKEEKTMFNDVELGRWSYELIKKASDAGILSGYPDGSFKPGEPITREEIAVVIGKMLLLNGTFEKGLMAEYIKSVVLILRGDNGLGSGFCFSSPAGEQSLIITNAHVAGSFTSFSLIKDGLYPNPTAQLVFKDEKIDLAVLRTAHKLPALKFDPNIYVGQPIAVIGSPKGYAENVTVGVVSHLNRPDKKFGLDAAVNPGNSGGAVINESGKVVGIVNSKIVSTDVEGMAFAIPAADIIPWLQSKGVIL
jgi:S1-C subfamily serine protease